jgi:gluconate kinase
MSYKIMILAPSAGGKSTLMRYLREHTDLKVAETDEEVVNANNGEWPADDYKNAVLIPKTTNDIISRNEVVYLMKDIPKDLLHKAREKGFTVVVLRLTLEQLKERNIKRMKEEGYDSAEQWFKGQLDYLENLDKEGLVDGYIDGNLPTEQIAKEVIGLASKQG